MMSKDEIQKDVKEIFIRLFPELRRVAFDFKKKQDDFRDWDSFMHMRLVSAMEEKFGKVVDMEEAMEADTPMRFVEMVSKKTAPRVKVKEDKTDVRPIFKNLSEALDYWADTKSDKVFVKSLATEVGYSYSDFNRLVNSGVRFLQKQGVRKGDIVLLCVRNSIEFLIMYFASARLGSIVNPVPPSVGKTELAANIAFIRPKFALIEKRYTGKDFRKRDIAHIEFEGRHALSRILKTFSDEHVSVDLKEDAPVCLYYSSGTTAKPKGILFSHRGLMNLVLLMCYGFDHHEDSVHLGVLPMGHTAVMHHSVLPTLYKGGTFVFSENFLNIRKEFWNLVRNYRVNYVQAVPTVLLMILNTKYPGYNKKALALKYIACGSAPLPESIKKPFEKKFGIRIANLYGLSEAGHLVADYPFTETWKPGMIGRPLDAIDLRIFNDEGKEVRTGVVGEFVVKTPGFFMGYYKDMKLYRTSFTKGYFRTGDMGYKDKGGIFYYTGRKKDIIIKGGVNISPDLIDEALLKHTKIAEAASIGKTDKFFGEIVKSFVVLKSGKTMSEKEFFAYCKKKLGDFKSPSEVAFVDAIPMTFSGKILRKNLRQKKG